jgi:hypothetical protein
MIPEPTTVAELKGVGDWFNVKGVRGALPSYPIIRKRCEPYEKTGHACKNKLVTDMAQSFRELNGIIAGS